MKKRGFRRIDIFWQSIIKDSATKTDDPLFLGQIDYGKHYPFPEQVVIVPLIAPFKDACSKSRFKRHFSAQKKLLQAVPPFRRIAQMEFFYNAVGDGPLFEIITAGFSPNRMRQLLFKIDSRQFVDFVKRFSVIGFLFFFSRKMLLWQLYIVSFRQIPQRFGETEAVIRHPKSKDIPSLLASEAMEHLLVLTDRERRRLFSMKRAKPHKIFTRLFELDKLAHNRNNIGRLLYLLFGRLVAYHGLFFICCRKKVLSA